MQAIGLLPKARFRFWLPPVGKWLAAAVVAAAGLFALQRYRIDVTHLTVLRPAAVLGVAQLPPPPSHVIVIVEENKSYSDVVGNARRAPFITSLLSHAAVFTHSFGVAHPSQPNYLALFAGITNTNGDGCPPRGIDRSAPNLAQALGRQGRSFGGYAESMPSDPAVCTSGNYARKHVPWTDFSTVARDASHPLRALPAFGSLPTVAFIVPNVVHDMHSASVSAGDAWLKMRLGSLLRWSESHGALAIVTWDESDGSASNRIPTFFLGSMVRPGMYDEPISHYRVLRTIEQLYGAAPSGAAARVAPIAGVWRLSAGQQH